MRNARPIAILSAVAVLTLAAAPAGALINYNFTPVDMVRQSKTILKVRVTVDAEGKALQLEVLEALKGDKPAKPVEVDLTTGVMKHQAETLAHMVRKAGKDGVVALLFVGKYKETDRRGGGGGGFKFEFGGEVMEFTGDEFAEAYLHFRQYWWAALYHTEAGGFEFDKMDSHMEATWMGSVDMLERAVRYILSDPKADVPYESNARWAWHKQSAEGVTGAVEARAVLLDDGLAETLWIARPDGDRLFAFDAAKKNLVDVTAARKLTAASRCGVWGDFNADGRADLLSHDGKKLTLHTQLANGTFAAAEVKVVGRLGRVVGLSVCDANADGRADALASTPGWPVLLANGKNGTFTARPLGEGKRLAIHLSDEQVKQGWKQLAGRCVVADLDGDARPDVLQPFSAGGAFYKGTPDGFAAPVVSAVGRGQPPAAEVVTADFDADGLLDILAAGEDQPRIWQNRGRGRFDETMRESGQLSYLGKGTGVAVDIGDFNNDGRQDCLLAYAAGLAPQLYFNRGFRSLGFSYLLDIYGQDLLPQSIKHGQSAACFGDFNGDGGEDLAVVVGNGEVWTFLRAVKYEDRWTKGPVIYSTLGVRVTLDARGGYAGPVNVVGHDGVRSLGAWRVDGGADSAWICRRTPGQIKLTWQIPGHEPRTKTVTLKENPVRVTIGQPNGK